MRNKLYRRNILKNEIMVSIDCITYNHEKYLADALDSFLMQKTNFKFEVLIHDDASTDNTREIINQYQNLYPEIIKPIFQTENQYQKGIQVSIFNFSRALGKYIAFCEGDDYWIDPYKLQKQVDFMESHPKCTLCFHNAIVVNEEKNVINPSMISDEIYNKELSAGDMAKIGFIPTASKMCPTYTMSNLPAWFASSVVGDYPSQLIASSYGYAFCLNEVMSAYRTNIPGSASSRLVASGDFLKKLVKHHKGFVDILTNFNKFTNNRYKFDIDEAMLFHEFNMNYYDGKQAELKKQKYAKFSKQMSLYGKMKFALIARAPKVFELIIRLKSNLSNL